jgi:hypothetical protein
MPTEVSLKFWMINPYLTFRTTITVICVCAQAGLEIKSRTETNQEKNNKNHKFCKQGY